jgi:hypothetical protein
MLDELEGLAAFASPLLRRGERDQGWVDARKKLRTFDPLLHVGHAWLVHLHKLKARAFELLSGLSKVASVGPEQCLVGGHHGRTCAAREAGEPLDALIRVRDVF